MAEVSLKEYVDCAIRAERSLRETQHEEVGKALEVARCSMEKRLDGMNEFREALRDQTAKAILRSEYELNHNILVDRIREVELSATRRETSARNVAIVAATITSLLAGIIITVITHWIVKP